MHMIRTGHTENISTALSTVDQINKLFDFVPYRLELAKLLGGIPINLKEQSLTDGMTANGIQGVDVAIDTSGKTSGIKSSLDALNYRGVLVCVGHGEELNVKVTTDLIFTERAVLGSNISNLTSWRRINGCSKKIC
jgi:threonine dehydrogenase-like Zn-dependent dehydrogenase